jgi:hypothetical protein
MSDHGVVIDLGLRIDLDRGAVSGGLTAPIPLRELVSKLGGPGRWALDWVPDIQFNAFKVGGTLDALDLSSKPPAVAGTVAAHRPRAFALTAKGGSVGAAKPEASLLVGHVVVDGTSAWMVEIELEVCVDLGTLPVLGSSLAGTLIGPITVRYCVGVIPAGILPGPAPRGHPRIDPGVSLSLLIQAGGTTYQLRYPELAPPPPPAEPPDAATGQPSGSKDVVKESIKPDHYDVLDAETSPVLWFDVNRTFGPLSVGRLGIQSTPTRLGLGFDAALALPVVSVGLTGFQISFDKENFKKFEIALDGLAVAIESPSVSVQGGLVRTRGSSHPKPPTSDRYDGALMMKIGSYGLAAIGSFTEVDGAPSMFVFAVALGDFGGPPVFKVTGLAAGFGYNRDLVLPAVQDVQDFPLVKFASGSSGTPIDVKGALEALNKGGWIPPKRDSYWLAIGIKATSFELVRSFVVVTVQWGSELVIAVLGTSTLTMPAPSKNAAAKPFVKATLQLAAVLRPAQGTLQVTAELTPDSYVFDPACRLTGGFAFWTWFGPSRHAGDFVLTLGGYHPRFVRPDHYPVVPRLALEWRMSDALQVRGEAYFALTPSCVMAGGRLELTFKQDRVAASLCAYVDLLLSWSPFFFSVSIGVAISVSYRAWWGAIDASLSVDLELWGPPLRGVARVSWCCFSFSIAINGGHSEDPGSRLLASWSLFEDAFLQKPDPKQVKEPAKKPSELPPAVPQVIAIRAAGGLIGEVAGHVGDVEVRWLMTADGFAIELQSEIPANEITTGSKDPILATNEFGVYPLGLSPPSSPDARNGVKSAVRVTITPVGGKAAATAILDWSPVEARVPYAMWGPENDTVMRPRADTVLALVGVRGTPRPPKPRERHIAPITVLGKGYEQHVPLPAPPPDPAERCAVSDIVATMNKAYGADALPATTERPAEARSSAEHASLRVAASSAEPAPPTAHTGAQPAPQRAATSAVPAADSPVRGRGSAAETAPIAPLALFRRLALPTDTSAPVRSRLVAYTADRQASSDERAVLEAARLQDEWCGLEPGSTIAWRIDAARPSALLQSIGPLALRVVALDLGANVLADLSFSGGDPLRLHLPARTVTVAVSAGLEPDAGPAGWTIDDALLQLGPFALLGERCVVGGQAPTRVPGSRRRGSRAVGVATAHMLRDSCWVEGAHGPEPGFVQTTLPAVTQSIVVALRQDEQAPPDAPAAEDACQLLSATTPGEVGELVAVDDKAIDDEAVTQLTYEIAEEHVERAAQEGTLFHAVTRAEVGWEQEGVVGLDGPPTGRAAAPDAMRPVPAALSVTEADVMSWVQVS